MLNKDINYIVSGLERSGTSMMMQVLQAGNLPIVYDNSRPADKNNPKGYYELEGGRIISKLIGGNYSLEPYKGRIIKITSYGLQFLPEGKYKIIYMERDIHEILKSMSIMADIEYDNRIMQTLTKLNDFIKDIITQRENTNSIFINYNEFIKNPEDDINTIARFLNCEFDVNPMVSVVDKNLYRNRH